MKIKIYQLPVENSKTFMNYNFITQTKKEKIDISEYELVFEGEVEASNLEEVFTIFNVNHPEGYKGRSLSVSDVVEVDETYWFCDSWGFKNLL